MEMIVSYLAGVVVLAGVWAMRVPHEDIRIVFVLCLFWPVSITLIALMLMLQGVGWDIDTAEGTKMFGFRRPTNPKAKGFAVTLFGTEIQFYSMKKA
jgi:hypothetical protein